MIEKKIERIEEYRSSLRLYTAMDVLWFKISHNLNCE